MYSKSFIWLGVFVGSTIGGLIPYLWGADMFSPWPILLSSVGALVGIWGAVKISDYLG
jgi:hypothetical protein